MQRNSPIELPAFVRRSLITNWCAKKWWWRGGLFRAIERFRALINRDGPVTDLQHLSLSVWVQERPAARRITEYARITWRVWEGGWISFCWIDLVRSRISKLQGDAHRKTPLIVTVSPGIEWDLIWLIVIARSWQWSINSNPSLADRISKINGASDWLERPSCPRICPEIRRIDN